MDWQTCYALYARRLFLFARRQLRPRKKMQPNTRPILALAALALLTAGLLLPAIRQVRRAESSPPAPTRAPMTGETSAAFQEVDRGQYLVGIEEAGTVYLPEDVSCQLLRCYYVDRAVLRKPGQNSSFVVMAPRETVLWMPMPTF